MIALLLAFAISDGLSPGSTYALDPTRSTIRYTVVHRLHEVQATSHEVEGRVLVREDGAALAQVRASVASFRSGDGNRDSHMLEVVQAGQFPFVTVKVVLPVGLARELPAKPLVAEGEVDFHGVKRRTTFPVTVSRQPDGSIRATGTFDVSLDTHGVERPSLLFVKVDDACRVDFDVGLRGDER